ncbi:atherin-like [Camellia sinensis]|uniref:atherin-like n=1 Tax=Camellia sinensis TaxID=4442 RepID=UPI001035F47F|nr:atherin-like [Camellia sinensis]
MPPLTEARIPMMRPAGMSSSGQARAQAADAPSTSRAGTSRGGSRPVPPAPSVHPHPGWPDMPTELMAWQYGASFPTPIPLEPPMPSDRYAIDPDSPPPSRGYMEEVDGLVATLEGMVLWREAQLSVAGIQGAGPSRPSRGSGPSRPFRGARGGPVRRRRAHVVEVGPDEEEEDAEEEEEETTDRQLEASAEEGGSDSDDDDVPFWSRPGFKADVWAHSA